MSQANLFITQYCSIHSGKVLLNGKKVFADKNTEASAFLKSIYRYLDMQYPKFHKMDALCKLAILGAEQIHRVYPFSENHKKENIALVLCNKNSSLETDMQHQKSISESHNYFPSPAVFVYTLANIMLGEIAIKYGIKGENACLVQEKFDTDQFYDYCNFMFLKGETDCIIGGWVDFFENDYSTHLLCIEKQQNSATALNFDKNTLNQLFTN